MHSKADLKKQSEPEPSPRTAQPATSIHTLLSAFFTDQHFSEIITYQYVYIHPFLFNTIKPIIIARTSTYYVLKSPLSTFFILTALLPHTAQRRALCLSCSTGEEARNGPLCDVARLTFTAAPDEHIGCFQAVNIKIKVLVSWRINAWKRMAGLKGMCIFNLSSYCQIAPDEVTPIYVRHPPALLLPAATATITFIHLFYLCQSDRRK